MIGGRPPKDPDKRRSRAQLVHDWREVPNVPFAAGPELGRLRPDVPWFPPVLAWWVAVKQMPHAALWDVSDWAFAAETAEIKQEVVSGNFSPTLLALLTKRELEMAMTEASRRQHRIRYVDAESSSSEKPKRETPPAARQRLRVIDAS